MLRIKQKFLYLQGKARGGRKGDKRGHIRTVSSYALNLVYRPQSGRVLVCKSAYIETHVGDSINSSIQMIARFTLT